MKQPKRVLISGASIAGPALAYWLNHYGFEVTVVERAPALRLGGYSVDIRGAAISVLEKMGILDQVRSLDTQMTGVYFVNDKGKVKGKISEASIGNQHGMDIEIMREDLSTILFDLTKDKVTYIWGDSITSLDESMTGVEVHFINSKPDTFDLIIGADGIHSNVRTLKFGDEDQFKRTLGCHISIFEFENYLNLDHSQMLYTVPGKTVGMYSANDKSEAKGMFVFQSEPLQYDRYNTEEQKNLIKNAFEELKGWETPNLLKKLIHASDFYFDEVCQIHMPTWSDGRIALVGDAAYCPSPLSGQGTSLALVGAYVLAGELKAANGDYNRSFKCYEKEMRNFVEKNQKIGLLSAGGLVEKSNFKILLRNTMLRFPILMNAMFKMITRMIVKAAKEIELKEY
ncbi:FAD-dependent monooxygenase [Bacillus sp. AFS055030]|uniref:FAD-dependent monooxygenase n=1 Tax=Bacillus sp. AFS055030 TaxID=2033507 RepID=UPI000BFCC2DE|nr:FAD-dependent monooxygenase [Bacillus sp. AFS055030]PGL67888.1 FAD-dependent oxidoreductase [Bacillus sp. AFS055030]